MWNHRQMSHPKPKRYQMWLEGENPFPPEISSLASKLILELAVVEDMTGPRASVVKRDEYIARLVPRLRGPVARELRKAAITVSQEKLDRICQVSASETFVIRRLCEALVSGEVAVEDFFHLPFYRTYQVYFEQTTESLAKAFRIDV